MHIDSLDRIDRARADWANIAPKLDTSPMELIGRVLRIAHLADTQIRSALRRSSLDRGAFDVLATLRRSGHDRLTPTQLYRELVLTSGAITHRVDALERAGLIQRIPDPVDRRGSLVSLTPRGVEVADQAIEEHMRCEASMITSLNSRDQQLLADLLRRLLRELEDNKDKEEA